eukprot:CAMPEP_0206520484 /NCGR_PEP_ID=MMETSP0324_2-20121206/65782_1 /ASSEMBLY_ACC=CAM_ASM_000836 /TAXON_ID=2866 /ORGANISM="Crypthecodinium cohnii, Strain Seligo" /LENGTH=63 /DNA_ID=CAMNT_0054014201 /DNA_START=324 /DNA_END=512 /DNA_ORIENTATION=-
MTSPSLNTRSKSVVTTSKPLTSRAVLAKPMVDMPKACARMAITDAMSPTPKSPIFIEFNRRLW